MSEPDYKRYEIILESLQNNKNEQDEQNNVLDKKCSSMINILILIITIQCGVILNVNLFEKILVSDLIYLIKVLLILTLIINFISLILLIKSYNLKDFMGLTSEGNLIKYGENKELLEKMYQEICVDYKLTLENNRKLIMDKAKDMKYAFVCVLVSTGMFIFTILLCLEIMI